MHSLEINIKKTDIEQKTKAILCGGSKGGKSSSMDTSAHARLLVDMCCRDLRPFNMVEQPGFTNYLKAIKPNLKIPAATTLSRSALEDVYLTYLSTVKNFLKKSCPQQISLVLDMWTDSFKRRSYVNMRILFCLNFETECISLKTETFPHPHNKFTIAENIKQTLCDFGLERKSIVVVSDGGSNIIAALKLSKINRLGCSSHALHRLIVHDILQNEHLNVFANTVKKLKEIYRSLIYNSEKIRKIQNVYTDEHLFTFLNEIEQINETFETESQVQSIVEVEVPQNINKDSCIESLKNSNDTRWNSLSTMFKSFLKNQNVVNIALVEINRTELALNTMEKSLMQEFLEFLQAFEDATKYLQGRKYPTIHSNIVFFEKISSTIEENSAKVSFGESFKMYSIAADCFKKRFKIYKVHLVAALLDPIQKNWNRLDNWSKRVSPNMDLFEELLTEDSEGGISKIDIIFEEVCKLNNNIGETNLCETPTTSENAKRQKLSSNDIRNNIALFIASTEKFESIDPVKKEVMKFFASHAESETDTFTWWQKNGQEYPNIAKLAQSILCIPSTSASSEEAFSSAGLLVNAKRSSLNPITIKRTLFIHDNYELFHKLAN